MRAMQVDFRHGSTWDNGFNASVAQWRARAGKKLGHGQDSGVSAFAARVSELLIIELALIASYSSPLRGMKVTPPLTVRSQVSVSASTFTGTGQERFEMLIRGRQRIVLSIGV
jgi:hypothetical protein